MQLAFTIKCGILGPKLSIIEIPTSPSSQVQRPRAGLLCITCGRPNLPPLLPVSTLFHRLQWPALPEWLSLALGLLCLSPVIFSHMHWWRYNYGKICWCIANAFSFHQHFPFLIYIPVVPSCMEVVSSKMKVLQVGAQVGGRRMDLGSDTHSHIPESCWIMPSLFIPEEVIWVTSIFYLHLDTAFFAWWVSVCNAWAAHRSLTGPPQGGVYISYIFTLYFFNIYFVFFT